MPLLVFSLPVKSRNTSDVYYSYSCKWDCHAINVVTYWLITGKLNQQADQFGLKKCLPFSWYLHGDSTSPQVGDPPNNRCVMIMGCCLVKTFSPYDWWGHLWVGLVESPWKMAGAAWKAILTFQMPIPNLFFVWNQFSSCNPVLFPPLPLLPWALGIWLWHKCHQDLERPATWKDLGSQLPLETTPIRLLQVAFFEW